MPTDNNAPAKYICSITGQIMVDPVIATDGYTYEREAIEQWFQTHDISPRTNEKIHHKKLIINHQKRSNILDFLDTHLELYEEDEVYLPKSWVAECVLAIKQNQLQVVQRWLDKDKRLLSLKLEGDFTALHLACEFSSPELVDILLANLKRRNQCIMPGVLSFKSLHLNVLLERALNTSDWPKCELLLELRAEVEQPEVATQNTLLHRMIIKGFQQAVSWLLEKKALLESRNREDNTPLLLSVIHNDVKLTEFLLKMKANLQVKNRERQSPVLIALLNQNKPMLYLLVGAEKTALPLLHLAEERDEQLQMAFYNITEKGNRASAALILPHGKNPTNSCGLLKLSTLHMAAESGDVAMLRYLLQTQVATILDVRNANGDTPLHLAVQAGNDNIISLLLEAGASHEIKNEREQTIIELARIQPKPKIENLIMQTIGGFKQDKLKETNRACQVIAEQVSKISTLKNTLQSQERSFKSIQSNMQEKIEKLEQLLPPAVSQSLLLSSPTLIFAQPTLPVSFHISAVPPKVNQKEVEEFLKLVAEGEQNNAEKMLKNNPDLALMSGDVIDLSKRTFTGITGFQYGVWALDWHMWMMIRKYLPADAARLQAKGFETGSWVKTHGVHANLNTLIQAYQTTLDLYNASKITEGDKAWVEQGVLPVNKHKH